MASEGARQESGTMVLEDHTRRVLDRIALAIMGSDSGFLIPDPNNPLLHTTELNYRLSLGIEDGEVIWDDPSQILLAERTERRRRRRRCRASRNEHRPERTEREAERETACSPKNTCAALSIVCGLWSTTAGDGGRWRGGENRRCACLCVCVCVCACVMSPPQISRFRRPRLTHHQGTPASASRCCRARCGGR